MVINLGSTGEGIAEEYFKKIGWRIIHRNYAVSSVGEIDLIMLDPSGTLVFIEVKTMTDHGPLALLPEDHATKKKLGRVGKIAELFTAKHPEYVDEDRGWRIDLLAIRHPGNGLTENNNSVIIKHYENVAGG